VNSRLEELKNYVCTDGVPTAAMQRMARFSVAVDNWMQEASLQATAIQCWTAIEEFFGVVPCACMSMMSDRLACSACEVDVMGVVAMFALAQATDRPSALVDWNNNYGEDPDKAVIFHCSNLPKGVFKSDRPDEPSMDYQAIIAGTVGQENAYGTIVGRLREGGITYLRLGTDDLSGTIRGYVGEGMLTDDPLDTFGGYGVVQIPRLQQLLNFICRNGFEHHVAINQTLSVNPVCEALTNYLGWDIHKHV
jgi:L-fucose isomerase-like protein